MMSLSQLCLWHVNLVSYVRNCNSSSGRAGLRALSTSRPRLQRRFQKKVALALPFLPFHSHSRFSSQLGPSVLCMWRRSQRSKMKHSKVWLPVGMWRELLCVAVSFTIIYWMHFSAGTASFWLALELSLCGIWPGSNFLEWWSNFL